MVKERKYDAILASRALPGIDGIGLTKLVRKLEADEERLYTAKFGEKPRKVNACQLAYTDMASRKRLYMEWKDGCVSKPLNEQALLATMAAIHHKPPAQRRSYKD